ncbi:hypothetical protein [Hyphococcus sp.]|uniref:hypothetical protein n=1 Tax=Hyphococcus sp. TaxID=2038636 RepID=UPI00207ED8E0|nr:MAG: hypothetical protein DHS20C04_01410 [Marinicaulis sp.]
MRGVLILLLMAPFPVFAQALSPMQKEVWTYTDRFALQLKALNPYATPQRFSITVRDEGGVQLPDVMISAPSFSLPPGEIGTFYVWGAATERRRIVVCVTSQAFSTGAGAPVRGEVCGKYDIAPLGR